MRKNEYVSDIERRKLKLDVLVTLFFIAILILFAYSVAQYDESQPVEARKQCIECHNRQSAMTEYFRKNGSKSPEEMAYAVLQSKHNSRLLASIAVVESDGNPDRRNTGYKNRHDGAFQINSAHWGAVPKDAVGQARQAERILEELTDQMPIKTALNYYGGDVTKRTYANAILNELAGVP